MLDKIFCVLILVLSNLSFAQITGTGDSKISTDSLENKSHLYFSWQYFNAFRSFEDNTSASFYKERLDEKPINTQGLEFGTYIDFTKNVNVSLGLGLFNGGETWTFEDSISDSSFTYINKYRQVSLPIRLNFQLGNTIQPFGFIGIIPSSILGRKYESSFTNSNGTLTENDPIIFKTNINAFQFMGTAGLGVKFDFVNSTVFIMGEYRQHFTNTYTGLFLTHFQRLIGGSIGVSFRF